MKQGECMSKRKRLSSSERGRMIAESPELRKKIFERLLEHVRNGYSLSCFDELSEVSVRKYLKTYYEEFIEEDLDEAMRTGMQRWESIGKRQAEGSCLGNSRSWFYNMANRFGWREKVDIKAEHDGNMNVNVISYATSKQLKTDETDV